MFMVMSHLTWQSLSAYAQLVRICCGWVLTNSRFYPGHALAEYGEANWNPVCCGNLQVQSWTVKRRRDYSLRDPLPATAITLDTE